MFHFYGECFVLREVGRLSVFRVEASRVYKRACGLVGRCVAMIWKRGNSFYPAFRRTWFPRRGGWEKQESGEKKPTPSDVCPLHAFVLRVKTPAAFCSPLEPVQNLSVVNEKPFWLKGNEGGGGFLVEILVQVSWKLDKTALGRGCGWVRSFRSATPCCQHDLEYVPWGEIICFLLLFVSSLPPSFRFICLHDVLLGFSVLFCCVRLCSVVFCSVVFGSRSREAERFSNQY